MPRLHFSRCCLKVLGCLFLAVSLSLAVGPTVVCGQLTPQSMVNSAVSDFGPQYKDIGDAFTRFANRDADGARAFLERAKQKHPKLAPAEVMLAQLFFASNQADAGRAELEKAAAVAPNDPEAYVTLGDLAIQQRQLAEGESLFYRARTLTDAFEENAKRKRNFQIRIHAGLATVAEARAATNKENWETARQELAAWVEIDPENAAAQQRLGRAMFHRGQAKEAFTQFQAAAKLDEKAVAADIAMAQLYEDTGDRENAIKFVARAIKAAPKSASTQLAAGRWALQADRLEEAQKYADASLTLDPTSLDAKMLRGVVARLTGDSANAQKFLQSAVLQSPANFSASNQLALVLAEQDDDAKRQRALELAEINARLYGRNTPQAAEAVATLGWVYYQLGRTSDAQRTLQALLDARTLSSDAHYYIARVVQDQGRTEEAIKLLENALKNKESFARRKEASELLAKLTNGSPTEEPKEEDTKN